MRGLLFFFHKGVLRAEAAIVVLLAFRKWYLRWEL
jgi:hypothetical protein